MSVEIIACANNLNIKLNCLNFRVMHMQTHSFDQFHARIRAQYGSVV